MKEESKNNVRGDEVKLDKIRRINSQEFEFDQTAVADRDADRGRNHNDNNSMRLLHESNSV